MAISRKVAGYEIGGGQFWGRIGLEGPGQA